MTEPETAVLNALKRLGLSANVMNYAEDEPEIADYHFDFIVTSPEGRRFGTWAGSGEYVEIDK